jgi:hypothetical protein
MRFTGINLPQGSKILSARLTVRSANSRGIYAVVQAEATGNAASFLQGDRLVSALSLTDAFVDWRWSYFSGSQCLSPDLSQVIQEIVDRPDWTSGNAIAIVLWSQSIPSSDVQIVSYDNSPTTAALTAPILSISYAPNDPSAFENPHVLPPDVSPPTGDSPLAQADHYWRFDEGTGIALYDSIGGRHGTMGCAQWVPGKVGGAVGFAGQVDYATLPENAPVWLPQNDFTISVWVWFNTGTSTWAPVGNEVLLDLNYVRNSNVTGSQGYCVQRVKDTRRILFQLVTTEHSRHEDLYTSASLNKERWYHLVIVRRGAVQEIYIDGKLDSTRSCSSQPVEFAGSYGNDVKVNIGRYTTSMSGPAHHLDGRLDDLAIFDEALSAEAIRQIYEEAATSNQ